MITPTLKDDILKYVVDNRKGLSVTIQCEEVAKHLNSEDAIVASILGDFQKMGLVYLTSIAAGRYWYSVELTSKGIEYSQNNWFEAKAEAERMQIDLLIEDLSSAKEQIGLDRFNAIVSGLSLITSVFGIDKAK